MMEKNQKIKQANVLGRRIEVWNFVKKVSGKVNAFSNERVNNYSRKQDALLREVTSNYTIVKV